VRSIDKGNPVPLPIDSSQHNTYEARHRLALAFIDAHAAQHLDDAQLVRRCAAAIRERFDVSQRTAHNDAIHALAATQARSVPAYVDINHSTSAVVYVSSPRTGRLVAFTASELMALADQHREIQANRPSAAMRCGRRADR
jgi:hypothetical protein